MAAHTNFGERNNIEGKNLFALRAFVSRDEDISFFSEINIMLVRFIIAGRTIDDLMHSPLITTNRLFVKDKIR